MLAGTLILETQILHFRVVDAPLGPDSIPTAGASVEYTICDSSTGLQLTKRVPSARDFMFALGIALDFDGGDLLGYERAEAVQPIEDDFDGANPSAAVRALRWIP